MADKSQSEQSRRRDRLRAALRENLKRRKAQAKERDKARSAAGRGAETAEKSLDSAGIANEKQRD